MRERWRRRVGQVDKDQQTNDRLNTRMHSNSLNKEDKVHTKVAYQYPKKTPFRFPVIPDQVHPNEEHEIEIPAYKRKKTKKRIRQTDNPINMQLKDTPKEQADNQDRSKQLKQPFKPTEVASPIYGFQKRNRMRAEVEQVPAYERRERKEEVDNDSSLNGDSTLHSEEKLLEKDLPEQKEMKNEIEQKIKTDPVNKNTSESEPKQKTRERERKLENKTIHTSERNRKRSEPKKRVKREEKTNIKSQPFNVIMTPRDKHRLRKKEQAYGRQNRTRLKSKQPNAVKEAYALPHDLLNRPSEVSHEDKVWVEEQKLLLERTLKHFNVQAKVVHAAQGPSVTRFEVQPELGVKVSRIRNLNDDIKLNMAAKDIRIEAPIPGKNTVGIEIPNLNAQMVGLREVFTTPTFQQSTSKLSIGLGLDVEGTPLVTDISKMPHGLIAGATGSGKSVCINTILISLMYKSHYDDVKFLLIDPKMVELAPYNDIPHLVSPVITDIKAATAALKWAVQEMESRYEKFVKAGVRDINRFNEKMIQAGKSEDKLPFIVIVIDELADLMMISPQDVEDAICRIAQKARACGMHLLLATQRPSVDVITGLIKANIPTRIAFSVSSQVDSRTIIDMNGAERLLGKGDMLLIENGTGKSRRLQGAFLSDEEIERVTDYARSMAKPQYLFEEKQLLQHIEPEEEQDILLDEVTAFILKQNHVSTSLLQRQFRIGYNRAARLIDTLENRGMISGQNGSKPRDVLLSSREQEETL